MPLIGELNTLLIDLLRLSEKGELKIDLKISPKDRNDYIFNVNPSFVVYMIIILIVAYN